MKLSQLSAKPQLVKIELMDDEIQREFGEAIEFYTWDRQPMDVFIKLASATQDNTTGIINIVKTLLLDEDGKEILTPETMLPTNILMKAIGKVTEMLGK
ncbi:hypothetical protein UFOVP623_20 [uncultured Caudovirales phage]|uniref:Uncharacterized protein n=1 Tax=uncultured Caudovirales phage TaxID=2100421 RepID=A0A6J5N4V3_9CAUD|nr:hypothetical protein UFOVP623_20 [uncultured Caudovirales phage]